jgi:hypothetical protein
MAMQGMLSNSSYMELYEKEKYLRNSQTVAKVAIDYADALIVELNKREK